MKAKFPLLPPPSKALVERVPLLPTMNRIRRTLVARARSFDMITWSGTPYGTEPMQVLDMQEINDLCPRDGWPTVLLIHGGGWKEGDKEQFNTLMPQFSRKRVQAVAMNYRLAPTVSWREQVADVHQAIDFLREQQVDLKRIALWGVSAGGHLALLAALERDDIAAVVTIGAPTDLTRISRDEWQVAFEEDELKEASPLHKESMLVPPTFMLHGELDTVIPVSQLNAFVAKHPSVQSKIIPSGNHGLQWPPIIASRAKEQAFEWLIQQLNLPSVGSKWKRRQKKKQ